MRFQVITAVANDAGCAVMFHSISMGNCNVPHACGCCRFRQRYSAADPGRAEVPVGAVLGHGGQLHTVAQTAHQAVREHVNCPVRGTLPAHPQH